MKSTISRGASAESEEKPFREASILVAFVPTLENLKIKTRPQTVHDIFALLKIVDSGGITP